MIGMLSALNYMRWMKDESLHSQQFGGRAELCIEPQTRFHVFLYHCDFITSWCIGCFCYALWWTWVVVRLSHYMSWCMVLCPFSSLWGIKRLVERCLLLFLLLNRDLEALLQSISLQDLLHILVLGVLLSLLLHLIQRAKQRVCWMSSGTAESRQDWQVGLKISSCHFHTRSLKGLELKFVHWCPATDLEAPASLPRQPEAAADGGMSSVSVSAPKVSIPPSAHHYCFSLDLRSLGNLSLPHPIAATLRWNTLSAFSCQNEFFHIRCCAEILGNFRCSH